jgi:hypothetical protein
MPDPVKITIDCPALFVMLSCPSHDLTPKKIKDKPHSFS